MNYFDLLLAVLGFLISPFMVLIYSGLLALVSFAFGRYLVEDGYTKLGVTIHILGGLILLHLFILVAWYASVGMYPHVWYSLR